MNIDSASHDPRINRLSLKKDDYRITDPQDQLITFEVFICPKEGKPYEHAGPVHASDAETAFLFAKEQYGRRASCVGMQLIQTDKIRVTEYTDNNIDVYDLYKDRPLQEEKNTDLYSIFHLKKRGKQHVHAGSVHAPSYEGAITEYARNFTPTGPFLNVWVVKVSDILLKDDKVLWSTLPEKKYRDAVAYRVNERIEKFKSKNLL